MKKLVSFMVALAVMVGGAMLIAPAHSYAADGKQISAAKDSIVAAKAAKKEKKSKPKKKAK